LISILTGSLRDAGGLVKAVVDLVLTKPYTVAQLKHALVQSVART
jgi:hypothetical protein